MSKYSRILVAAVVSLATVAGRAEAHNPDIHERLVRDAITYIAGHGTQRQRAALAELIRQAGGEAALREALGNEAKLADFYEDLGFYSNSKTSRLPVLVGVGSATFFKAGSSYITRLQHYAHADRPADRWKGAEGYYYQWTGKTGDDWRAMVTAGFGPFDAAAADLEVDNERSIAVPRYQVHWRGTPQEWAKNWEFKSAGVISGDDWDIENTRFAPASTVAYYWLRRYQGFPAARARTQDQKFRFTPPDKLEKIEPGRISGVRLLGPVLHMAADVTVPQHALGSNALAHTTYEDDFQARYVNGGIRPSAEGVTRHLSERDFLRRELWSLVEPRRVESLQVTVVTDDAAGAGTDANVSIDFGEGQTYALDTPLDDFERWNDDTFTLSVSPGTLVEHLTSLSIRRDDNGGPWRLKGLYVMVNGVLLYGRDNIDTTLKGNTEWIATDFRPRSAIERMVWPVDDVLIATAHYTLDYVRGQLGPANVGREEAWRRAYDGPEVGGERQQRAQHLLDLAIATIVRTLEMAVAEGQLIDGTYTGAISRSYRDVLGREPAAAEIQHWTQSLATRPLPYGELLAMHVQWRASAAGNAERLATVTRSYQRVFGRTPGPAELSVWERQLAAAALTFPDVMDAHLVWLKSPSGNAERAAVVSRSYLDAFGRQPGTDEAAAWQARLATAPLPFIDVVEAHTSFIVTPDREPVRRDMVQRVFRGKGREATATEIEYWSGRIVRDRLRFAQLSTLVM